MDRAQDRTACNSKPGVEYARITAGRDHRNRARGQLPHDSLARGDESADHPYCYSTVRSPPKANDLARSSACRIRHDLEVFMTTYLRATSAIGSAFILAACTATTADVKPKAAASGAVAQNPACLTQTGS